MNLADLQQQRATAFDEMTAINTLAETEKRALTDEESTKWGTLEARIKELDASIKRKEDFDALQKRLAKDNNPTHFNIGNGVNKRGEKGEMKNIQKRHSLVKAMRSKVLGQKLEGVEGEMDVEARNEVQKFGRSVEGIGLPSSFINVKRDLVVGTDTAGGFTVATELGEMIPYLQPRLTAIQLGATVLSGLTANLDLPRNNGITSATWEGETDENAESDPTFDKLSLTPNRLGAYTDFSKQLLVQSEISPSVEVFVRRQLERAIAIALDSAAINGSGSGNQPTGILNTSGIGDVAIGTNGGNPTRDHLIDLISALAVDNADMGNLSFLTTPGVRGKLQKTKTDAGSGLFVWNNPTNLMGYNAAVSTQVPSTLDKGTSTGVCHAILFGNWSELMVAQWGGLDIVVNPYTKAKNAVVEVVANSWWDIALRHAESFAAVKDATIT